MNPLYTWSHEMIVDSERMEDAKREARRLRLLHASQPSQPGGYTRTALTFRNTLRHLLHHLSGKHLTPPPPYRTSDRHRHVA